MVRKSCKGPRWLIVAILAVFLAGPARAQSFHVLHFFNPSPTFPQTPLVQGSDGNFYGTTSDGQGGSGSGSIFRITPAGALTALYRFSGPDGAAPNGLVQASDGNFYGTTGGGGANNNGTIFGLTPGGVVTTLYFFSGADGSGPGSALIQASDGNLYGTTARGGLSGRGTAYRITLSGALTKLHDFSGADGSIPNGLVQASDGNFYGTTAAGGASDNGSIFRMTPAGTVTSLYSFSLLHSSGSVGPSDLVQGTDGDFYGTTSSGGGGGLGTVYKITSAGVVTTLYSFYVGGPLGPSGVVQGADGAFYGACTWGGENSAGAIFRMSSSGDLTTLFSFSGGDGSQPRARLVSGIDGNLYGTTSAGGTAFGGTVFKITTSGIPTSLFSFSNGEGSVPNGPLLQASDGNLYGTTFRGGALGYGTVFGLSPTGTFATLHSFLGTDGAGSFAGLVEGVAGTLYGTTRDGGTTGWGTLFSVTTGGVLSSLHSFSVADGSDPVSGLVRGTDGKFFGTTYDGGGANKGTVFRMTPGGAVTTLYSFSGSDGSSPNTSLALGTDGNFYGTTLSGGTGQGTIFRVTPGGTLTTLYTFSGPDGSSPNGLTLGQDGNFYGTTEGLLYQSGCVIFRMTPSGVFTTLHAFPGSLGSDCPTGPLLLGANGDFFGTTYRGTIFEMTPAGILATVYTFSGPDGSYALSPLVQGSDGDLYGVTSSGGPSNAGVVFRLNPSGPPTPRAVVSGGGTICLGSSTSVQAALTGTPPWSLTWSDGSSQTGITTSPAIRTVSPQSAMVYTLTAISDANGPGLSSGSATVLVTQPLSAVTLSPATPILLCAGAQGSSASVSALSAGGGTSTYQWGYRTVSGGAITPIPGFASSQVGFGSSTFPGPGAYLLVATVTPTCGSPVVSSEVAVTVAPSLDDPIINAPAWVAPGATNVTASVAAQAGAIYVWWISNGFITGGGTTNQVSFTAGLTGSVILFVSESTSAGCTTPTAFTAIPIATAFSFYAATPCRQLDTRTGGTPIAGGSALTVPLTGAPCSIPSTAKSVSVNVTVTQQTAGGDLTIYPADQFMPGTTALSFSPAVTRANNGVFLLSSDGQGAVTVFNNSLGPVHLIIDVNGYFQ